MRKQQSSGAVLLALLLAILGLRLSTLGSLSYLDPSEGRYALVGKLMLSTGDWLSPEVLQRDGSLVEFWGKPPLFFWLLAGSFKFLGVNEFSARVPSCLTALLSVAAVYFFAQTLWDRRTGLLAGLILSSSVLFFFFAGACQIDMALTACVAFAMLCFGKAVITDDPRYSKTWGYAFFAALAAGMVCKGPVAVVLTCGPIGLWCLWRRSWKELLKLPIIGGGVFFICLSAPWYLLVERHSPGFLKYFFLNENLLRFVSSEYGDKYGAARGKPWGTSWAFLWLAFLPWSFYLVPDILNRVKQFRSKATSTDERWEQFALCWGVFPALFFCFAHGLLFAYVLPGLPGLAIYCARRTHTGKMVLLPSIRTTKLPLRRMILGLLYFGATALFIFGFSYELEFFPSPSTSSHLLAVLLLAVLLSTLFMQKRFAAQVVIAQIAIATALGFSSALASAAIYLGDHASTSGLLLRIHERYGKEAIHLNFPFGIPYSAQLYSTYDLEAETEELKLEEYEQEELILVKDYDTDKLEELAPGPMDLGIQEEFRIGPWVAYRKRKEFSLSPLVRLEAQFQVADFAPLLVR